jgi:hypothetical protein
MCLFEVTIGRPSSFHSSSLGGLLTFSFSATWRQFNGFQRFMWCESMRSPTCMSMSNSPHYIVGLYIGTKMESLWAEGMNMGKAA